MTTGTLPNYVAVSEDDDAVFCNTKPAQSLSEVGKRIATNVSSLFSKPRFFSGLAPTLSTLAGGAVVPALMTYYGINSDLESNVSLFSICLLGEIFAGMAGGPLALVMSVATLSTLWETAKAITAGMSAICTDITAATPLL